MRIRSASVTTASAVLIGTAVMFAPAASSGAPQAVHHGTVRAAHVSPVRVLYNQNDDDADSAITSQNFEAQYDAFDNQAADDFRVPANTTWKVKKVIVTGTYQGFPGPASSENVFYYKDAGGLPGTLRAELDNIAGADSGGNFVIPAPVRVKGGDLGRTYWVSVQINMDFSIGGQWYWETRSVQTDNRAAWQNPGNGFGTNCTTWATMQTCLGFPGPDLMFALSGRSM